MAVAALVLLLGGLWIATGPGFISRPLVESRDAETPSKTTPLVRVRVSTSKSKLYRTTAIVRGATRASRSVTVRSEVKGRVLKLLVGKGAIVESGQPLIHLDLGSKHSSLREAEARVSQASMEHEAATKLLEQGYRAQANLAVATTALEGALSQRNRIQHAIQSASPKAPFRGVLSALRAEVGDYVMEGQAIATVTDLDPIFAEGRVSEHEYSRITLGAKATMRLLDGRTRSGKIRYLSSVADPATRTFSVEAEFANPDHAIVAGLTAELEVESRSIPAHLVPASVLTLDDSGQLGVKIVGDQDKVAFYRVQPVGQAAKGMWITGLPEAIRVIVVGSDYAGVGTRVVPQDAGPMHLILNK